MKKSTFINIIDIVLSVLFVIAMMFTVAPNYKAATIVLWCLTFSCLYKDDIIKMINHESKE